MDTGIEVVNHTYIGLGTSDFLNRGYGNGHHSTLQIPYSTLPIIAIQGSQNKRLAKCR